MIYATGVAECVFACKKILTEECVREKKNKNACVCIHLSSVDAECMSALVTA